MSALSNCTLLVPKPTLQIQATPGIPLLELMMQSSDFELQEFTESPAELPAIEVAH